MAVDLVELTRLVQISSIAITAAQNLSNGMLTDEELELAWKDIESQCVAARVSWMTSKMSPAAKARRHEETNDD
jgi:hypothetical protein